ncbi:FecR domain-containing protein [Rhodopirellula sp. MGV]|uniref:FecR domain-containing protein n=1 Tax=Rhodopirellula sp. MGV TaxID=2023130 RepID=UPI000B969B0D|nr:FecR domain-containing protein [Rhodopirellula sp. MGV]OYP28303.1 hypothetical protein CGZ80_26145 [Rhodopirellula sp. MGV]PNY38818.1 iron dicitrate transport regulator FecR [Rhodopirellula baltica]
MSDEQRFAELWTDYLEGELDASSMGELRQLLESNDQQLRQAADLYQTHRLLNLVGKQDSLADQQDDFVEQVMKRLPRSPERFVDDVMAGVQANASNSVSPVPVTSPIPPTFLALIAATLIGIVSLLYWQAFNSDAGNRVAVSQNRNQRNSQIATNQIAAVRFANLAHAKFFGELLPPVDSALAHQRDYVLMTGLAEVHFPSGAEAIVEGPAVFRVLSDECLGLDVGKCSVHAPDGAEGFRIETPMMRVVDRGTRFTINVGETSETEVHVVEGAADVYETSTAATPAGHSQVHLTDGQAQRFAALSEFGADPIEYDPRLYRRELPDRVISYDASKNKAGHADQLVSVTVQRGGQIQSVPVEQLIRAKTIAFSSPEVGGFLCGPAMLPGDRASLTSDNSLVTGVINPGGSRTPYNSDPVLAGDAPTPGMAIQFDRPVVNGPGDDLVVFDLQAFSNPPDGDAFHIGPLRFRDGLKVQTITSFDLTLESPSAHPLADFYVHMFPGPVSSVDEVQSTETVGRRQTIRFRGLVVGVDLTDLGFDDGESVDGLFIQDALDDDHHIDPVFIGGLPPLP